MGLGGGGFLSGVCSVVLGARFAPGLGWPFAILSSATSGAETTSSGLPSLLTISPQESISSFLLTTGVSAEMIRSLGLHSFPPSPSLFFPPAGDNSLVVAALDNVDAGLPFGVLRAAPFGVL